MTTENHADMLRKVFANTDRDLARRAKQRDTDETWQPQVEQILATMVRELVSLRERVDAVEAKIGPAEG